MTRAPGARAFHAAFVAAGEAASAAPRDHDVLVAGVPIRLRFAGPDLEARMLPPFGHLPRFTGAPAFTIVAWDGPGGPRFPWRSEHVGPLGRVEGLDAWMDQTSGGLTLWDADRATVYVWVPTADRLPWWEHITPFYYPLSFLVAGPGRELVHAGAVGSALLVGPSGSGKSTTAIACMEAGMPMAGDDHVVLDVGEQVVAHSVHRAAKLDAGSLARLPSVHDALWRPPRPPHEKAGLLFGHERPIAAALTLTHLLVPRISDEPVTRVRPISAAAALRALAPSTIFQVPDAGGRQLRTLAAAVRRLECLELVLGRDDRAPDVVAAALAPAEVVA